MKCASDVSKYVETRDIIVDQACFHGVRNEVALLLDVDFIDLDIGLAGSQYDVGEQRLKWSPPPHFWK